MGGAGRDNKACRKRWIHSLDPKLRKGTEIDVLLWASDLRSVQGRWTSAEDAILLEAVGRHGNRWYEVAKDLPGRTDDQCAKRYKEAVDPSIRKNTTYLRIFLPLTATLATGRDPWTKEEDEQLWEAFQRLGNKWHAISCNLNGRPGLSIFSLFVVKGEI